MPLDDFRRRISAKDKPDFDALASCAARYDVSLAAAILRWLRYTDRRALIIVSMDGFVKWAWSSTPAFKTGCFIRTSQGPLALPPGSAVGQNQFTPESKAGIDHPVGVWFNEPVREHSLYIFWINDRDCAARYQITIKRKRTKAGGFHSRCRCVAQWWMLPAICQIDEYS